MAADFRTLLKAFRLRAGVGLRRFAEKIGESPSNYAGVESGSRGPWRPQEKLRHVAESLGLREGSEDWDAFFVAAKGYVGLPPDVEHMLERPMIPALLRTVNDAKLTEEELRIFVEDGILRSAIEKLRKKRAHQRGNSPSTD